jgi:TolB protein
LWQWKTDGQNGAAVPLWNSAAGRVSSGTAISFDGKSLAFAIRQNGRNVLYVASSDGTGARPLAETLDLRNTPSWSPDGQWIAVAADAGEGSRIFRVSAKTGESEWLTDKVAFNAVWSPDGGRIVYYDGTVGGANFPLRAVRPDKTAVAMPDVSYRGDFEGYRFMPDGKSLVILQGQFRAQDFWLLNLDTGERRQLTRLKPGYSVRSFDVSRDGKEILFDRVQENSDIVLIDRK